MSYIPSYEIRTACGHDIELSFCARCGAVVMKSKSDPDAMQIHDRWHAWLDARTDPRNFAPAAS